jgi:hypothetical protein
MLPRKPGGDSGKLNVHGFVDTDWAGDMDRRGRPTDMSSRCSWSNKLDE